MDRQHTTAALPTRSQRNLFTRFTRADRSARNAMGLVLLAAGLLVGGPLFAGNHTSPPANAKCETGITFTTNPAGWSVPAGTDIILKEEIKVTAVGAGSQDCGLAVGQYVNAGNAKIASVQLGGAGPARACNDLGKKFCSVGQSILAGNACSSNDDCVTDPTGSGQCTMTNAFAGGSQMENSTDGIFEHTVNTTGLAGQTLGYQAEYNGTGQFLDAAIICNDVIVTGDTEPCSSGATITIEKTDGPGVATTGARHEWTYTVTVHACEDLAGVTAQGGTNGWAPLESRDPISASTDDGSVEVRNANKKAEVLLWTIGNMNAGDEAKLDVTLAGTIPNKTPDCQPRYLSGPWSTRFSTDEGATFTKSSYTGRVTILVDSNGDDTDCN